MSNRQMCEGKEMTTGWQDKNCGCCIEVDIDDRGVKRPYIERCLLHEFAEGAAKLLNKAVKSANSDAWVIMEAQNLLDNYGLLEE